MCKGTWTQFMHRNTHAHTQLHMSTDAGVDHPAPKAEGSFPRSPKCTSHCPALRLRQGNEASKHSSPGAGLGGGAWGGFCFPRRVAPALVPVSCSFHPPLSSLSGTLAAESGVIETSVPSAGCLPRPLHLGGFFWGSGHGSPGCCRLCSLAPPYPGLPQWAGSQEDGSPLCNLL